MLNADFAARPECIEIPTQAHRTAEQEDFPVYMLGTQTPESLQPFVATGLLSAGVEETTEVFNMFGSMGKTLVRRFDLTDEGKKFYRDTKTARAWMSLGIGGPAGVLCYGKREVVKIDHFTEPSDVMGMHVTEVTFTSHLAPGVATWIRNSGFLAVDPLLKSQLSDEPSKAQATLQLTNKGWMVFRNGG